MPGNEPAETEKLSSTSQPLAGTVCGTGLVKSEGAEHGGAGCLGASGRQVGDGERPQLPVPGPGQRQTAPPLWSEVPVEHREVGRNYSAPNMAALFALYEAFPQALSDFSCYTEFQNLPGNRYIKSCKM